MVNRRHKPVDQLQDQRASRTRSAPVVPPDLEDAGLPLAPGEFGQAPPAPANLLPGTVEDWKVLWASPLRQHLVSADMTLLRRYFWVLDENARAWTNYRRKKTGIGSTGQTTVSHWWTVIKDTEAMAERLEASLGIGPLSRMRLNVSFADAVTKMAEAYALAAKGKSPDGQPGEWVTE